MKESKRIKGALNKSIKTVCQSTNQYCRNPEKDFSRRKKLPVDKVIKTVLGFSSKSLTKQQKPVDYSEGITFDFSMLNTLKLPQGEVAKEQWSPLLTV